MQVKKFSIKRFYEKTGIIVAFFVISLLSNSDAFAFPFAGRIQLTGTSSLIEDTCTSAGIPMPTVMARDYRVKWGGYILFTILDRVDNLAYRADFLNNRVGGIQSFPRSGGGSVIMGVLVRNLMKENPGTPPATVTEFVEIVAPNGQSICTATYKGTMSRRRLS